jgi:hypothetical protein
VLGALASVLIIPAARPAAADGGPTVTSASAQDDGNGQFSVSFSWSSPGDPVVQYIVSNSGGMCTQAQNISSESGSVQDQPCEDPFNYGDTLYVYISTASDNCNGWQDPSGDDDGYPLTLPPAPVTTTTTEPYSPPVTEAPAPVTTTTTEPAPVPTTPSVLTPSSSPCSENDPFIVDYQALQAEVQRATAQLDVLERQLDQVRGDVTLSASTREREASQLAEIAIPEQKKSIAKLESGLERMAPTVEQIKADCAGQSAQGEGTDLPQQANLGNGQVLAQFGAKGFAELPWFVDVQSGALYWTEHHLTTFSCRFGSVPDPGKASFILQRCRYVVTPQAVAVLLGTEFAVNVSRGATAFRVFSGEVDVTDLAGTKTVRLAAGQMTTVNAGGVPSEPVPFASASVRHWWAHSAFVGSWLFYLLIGLCVVAALAAVRRRQLRATFAALGPPTVRERSAELPLDARTSVATRSGEPFRDGSVSSSRSDVPGDAVETAADDPILALYARHLRALVVGGFASLTVGLGLMVTATAVSHHHAPGAAEGLWVAAWILFLPGPVCVVALLARFLQVRPRIRPRSTETALQVQGSEAQVVALCQKALAMQRFKGISVENDGMIVARLRTTGQRRRSQIEVRVEPTESGVLVHARCEARPESAASLFRHPSELVVAKFASGLSALTVVCRIQRGAQGDPQLFDASSQRISEPGSAHGLPEDRGVNGLAVAALVLGILWIFWVGSILAAIFGHIGLGQIRRRGQSGRGMALAGVLLGWAGIAVLVSAVVLATVTGLNAEDRKPPAQILRDAISASEKASSVHLSGWSGGSSSSLANVDLVLSKGASGGSIIESEGTFGLVVANGYVYLKADASFWQQTTGDPSAAQTLGGRWIKGSEKSSDFSGFSKLTQVFGQIKVRGKLFKESDVQLDGMSVIPLTDSAGTTIYVADTGQPHIVRIVHSALSPEGPGQVNLDEYGTAPVPSVPTGAIDMTS